MWAGPHAGCIITALHRGCLPWQSAGCAVGPLPGSYLQNTHA